jgi:8-oxo-dGTP diphosphatase
MSEPSSPTLVVCAIIEHEGRILLAQRPAGKRLGGYWEFPGGKVETGEDSAAALHRELAEELDCTVAVVAAGPAHRHDYEWGAIALQPFLCRLVGSPSELIAHEHAALRWVKAQDLPLDDLAPADIPVWRWVQGLLQHSNY